VVPTTDPFAAPGIAQVPTVDPNAPFFQEQQPEQQPPIDPVFLTATAIIAGATATESSILTATAQGSGIGIPTFTPTPTATTFLPGVPTTAPGINQCVHVVSAGQNLFRIALQYNVDVYQLAQFNNIPNMNLILVGQQINIPNCSGGVVITPAPGGGTATCSSPYMVQQGDTLYKISLRCGVSVMSIASANGISNINLILINQQLNIPPA
jgi:LysM repeat protein